jgi:hypothetical protein
MTAALRSPGRRSHRPVVNADIPARAAGALSEAVARLVRVGGDERAARTRALTALAAGLTPAPGAQAHRVVLDATEAELAAEAARWHIADRAGAGYQPPAERARLADLRETLHWLADAQARGLLDGLAL